jgi:hypothetical protein
VAKQFETLTIKKRPTKGKKPMSPAMAGATYRNGNGANGHDHNDSADERAELKLAINNVEAIKEQIANVKADVAECKQEIYDFFARERRRLEREGLTLTQHESDTDNEEIRKLRTERKGLEEEIRQHEKKLMAAEVLAQKAAHAVIRAEGHAQKVYDEACQLANKLNTLLPELRICLRHVINRPDDPRYFRTMPADERALFDNLTQFVHNPLSETFIRQESIDKTQIHNYVQRLVIDPDATL